MYRVMLSLIEHPNTMFTIKRLVMFISFLFLAACILPSDSSYVAVPRSPIPWGYSRAMFDTKKYPRSRLFSALPTHVAEYSSSTLPTAPNKAVEIALSYQPSSFRPAPFARNPHIQTIGGAILRGLRFLSSGPQLDFSYWPPLLPQRKLEVVGSLCTWWDRRVRIDTPDGDFFDVDYKYCIRNKTLDTKIVTSHGQKSYNSKNIAVMLHGLESSSCSPQIIDAALALLAIDMDVICVNFRSCSGEPNRTPGAYHLGFTDDLKFFLSHILPNEAGHDRNVYLVGFSLGANVVLKLLGELQNSALSSYNVRGAAVSAAPFDLVKSAPKFAGTTFNRLVYDSNFLQALKRKAEIQYEMLGEHRVPYKIDQVQSAQSVAEFENAFIAPIYGFSDNYDYYEKTSSLSFIDKIHVPTLVINSSDDPFFDPSCYPKECPSRPIKLHYTQHGGHLGFIFHMPENDTKDVVSSWMPTELARFLCHVREQSQAPLIQPLKEAVE